MEYLPTKCFIEDNNIITTATVGGLLLLSLILNIVQSCRCRNRSLRQPDMETGTSTNVMNVPIVNYPSPSSMTSTRREFQLSRLTRDVIRSS